MKKLDFARAASIARSDRDLTGVDDTPFLGCGLPGFAPIFVTVEQVAKFVRWQSATFAGGVDANALAECAEIARHKFVTVDKPMAECYANDLQSAREAERSENGSP